MKATLALVPLLALATLPVAAAEHAACGAADGTVVDGLALWLRPGCLGAVAYVPGSACEGSLLHATILGVYTYADLCSAGVWLP